MLVVNKIIRLICRICSKLIVKTLERRLLRSFFLLLLLNIFSLYSEVLWLMLNIVMFAVSLPNLIAEPTVCRPLKILVILFNFLVMYVHILLFYNIRSLTYFHAWVHQAINILLAFLVNTDYFWYLSQLSATLPFAEMQTYLFMKSWTTSHPVPFYILLGKKISWGKKLRNLRNECSQMFFKTSRN